MIEHEYCPCCFNTNIKTFDYFGEYQTICLTCFTAGPGHNRTMDEAEEAWNKVFENFLEKHHSVSKWFSNE